MVQVLPFFEDIDARQIVWFLEFSSRGLDMGLFLKVHIVYTINILYEDCTYNPQTCKLFEILMNTPCHLKCSHAYGSLPFNCQCRVRVRASAPPPGVI
jgi:hypothetical protein